MTRESLQKDKTYKKIQRWGYSLMLEDEHHHHHQRKFDLATTIANLYKEYCYKHVIVLIFFLSAIASSVYPYVMSPFASSVKDIYNVKL